MKPPYSVIFLTTLIGVGQGLFLALYMGDVIGPLGSFAASNPTQMMLMGSLLVIVLMVLGGFSAIFHLGKPGRAWRSVSQWRTSWLSREIILLLAFTGMVALWEAVRLLNIPLQFNVLGRGEVHLSLIVGLIAAVFSVALYICTAMVYVAIKCIQEWASPLTVVNYLLLGLASGFTLAAALASYFQSPLSGWYAAWSIGFILAATISRMLSLFRNARIKRKSSAGKALGVRQPLIRLISQGVVDGVFNTREFFRHTNSQTVLLVMIFFPVATFVVPFLLVAYGWAGSSTKVLIVAVLIQYLGLLAERWFFFAQANHPKNLYYQG